MLSNPSMSATRLFGFDYGHRVLGHGGKCAGLHGHRGTAEVECAAIGLDALGMVIDFGVIKDLVGGWIDEQWDHAFLVHPDDPLRHPISFDPDVCIRCTIPPSVIGPKPLYVMPGKQNPTAENMARVLYAQAQLLLSPHNISIVRVKLWETPNCFAECR